jgi:hypothetical protein
MKVLRDGGKLEPFSENDKLIKRHLTVLERDHREVGALGKEGKKVPRDESIRQRADINLSIILKLHYLGQRFSQDRIWRRSNKELNVSKMEGTYRKIAIVFIHRSRACYQVGERRRRMYHLPKS